MTASFSTIKLTGQRVLVRGTDKTGGHGETTVSSLQWDSVNAHRQYKTATEACNAAIDEFFSPINEALDALANAVAQPEDDSVTYIVFEEGVEPTAGRVAEKVHLTKDSQILRLIEQGNFDRLIWVNDDLEIMAADASVPDAPVVDEVAVAEPINPATTSAE